MDPIFLWIEQTTISTWLRESPSLLAFPTMLILHTVGMAFLVGGNAAIDLRILGFAPAVPLSSLAKFFPVLWAGLILNTASGLALLIAYPVKVLTNPLFYLKLLMIALALINVWWVRKRVLNRPFENQTSLEPFVKYVALASLVFWAVAVTAGRLLAYTYVRLMVGD